MVIRILGENGARRLVTTAYDLKKRPIYEQLAADRAGAIFDPGPIEDPMERKAGRSVLSNRYFPGASAAAPFRLIPSEFLARARARPPESPDVTASAFANWVYSLYGNPGSDPDALERGLAAEGVILEARTRDLGAQRIISSCGSAYLAKQRPDWRLEHCGLHLDPENDQIPFYELDDLVVGNSPLRASPDLLYRNRKTGEVIIVEVKMSRQPIPPNLWPNVWAQLWCYANIPVARNATQITVVGEIWGELHKWARWKQESLHWVCLRASVRLNPRAPAFDRFFRSLFDVYRGHVEQLQGCDERHPPRST